MELSQADLNGLFRAVQEREAAILRKQNEYLRGLLAATVGELANEQDRIRHSEMNRMLRDPKERLRMMREHLKKEAGEPPQREG